jgi:predicted RNA-binding Zn-ribbon protein involved in translation (DUF1610 family)
MSRTGNNVIEAQEANDPRCKTCGRLLDPASSHLCEKCGEAIDTAKDEEFWFHHLVE